MVLNTLDDNEDDDNAVVMVAVVSVVLVLSPIPDVPNRLLMLVEVGASLRLGFNNEVRLGR